MVRGVSSLANDFGTLIPSGYGSTPALRTASVDFG